MVLERVLHENHLRILLQDTENTIENMLVDTVVVVVAVPV